MGGRTLIMKTVSLNVLRENLFTSIENVIECNEPITVSTKRGQAVIVSEADYNTMLGKLYFSSKESLVQKIKDGDKENIAEMASYNPYEEW